MTPGQLNRHLLAHGERNRLTLVQAVTSAWWSAGFSRAKKLPRLETVINRLLQKRQRDDKPAQTWQDMKAVAMQWVAHMRKANGRGRKP